MTTKAPTVLTTTKWSGQVDWESSLPSCHSKRVGAAFGSSPTCPAQRNPSHTTTIVHLHTSLNIHPDFRISVVKMAKKCKSHKKIIKDSCTSAALIVSSHLR